MDYKKFAELMDSFSELNNSLEVCRGYAQSEEPDMKALEDVLYSLQLKYREIYKQICFFRKGAVGNE